MPIRIPPRDSKDFEPMAYALDGSILITRYWPVFRRKPVFKLKEVCSLTDIKQLKEALPEVEACSNYDR